MSPGVYYAADVQEPEWLSTRSLLFAARGYEAQAMNEAMIYGIGSTTINQSWRNPGQENPIYPHYNMETRQWSHIAIGWDWSTGNFADTNYSLVINGKAVGFDRSKTPVNDNTYEQPVPLHAENGEEPYYIRFGESSSARSRNDVADSTYDDICSSDLRQDEFTLSFEYGYGRYYEVNDAVYTSPEFDLFKEFDFLGSSSAQTLTLHAITWTGYWPKAPNPNYSPNHPRFNDNHDAGNSNGYAKLIGAAAPNHNYNPAATGEPGEMLDPMAAKWGGDYIPFFVDVINPATGLWYYANVSKELMPNYAGGSMDPDWQGPNAPLKFKQKAGRKLRFRVHFNLNDSIGQTLYTSPIFDDITFVFKRGIPKILSWLME